jgi:hypothetical protein
MSQAAGSLGHALASQVAATRARARRRTVTWSLLLLLVGVVCFFDGTSFAAHFAHGQWLANVLMLLAFVPVYRAAPSRLRGIMKYGVVIATAGEVLFSLVFGMYEYRNGNVPLYVPPGHSLMYAAVYYFVREPLVLRHRRTVISLLLTASIAYAAYWLVAHDDVYGALCTGLFVVLISRDADSRLFFMSMFVFVGILEQLGTRFGAWYWHPYAFDRFSWLPSGNPPTGISVFYFAFDGLCLLAYLRRRKHVTLRYERLKSVPAARSPGPVTLDQG